MILLVRVCGRIVATGPVNGGNSDKQQAGTPSNHTESDGCSRRHSGWDKCWYPPFSGEESEENVTPGADWQTEREEAQGRSDRGPRPRNYSCSRREGIAEGSPPVDRIGDCTGQGGVQGAGLWCDPKQKYYQ
jgi:hypothetical protein